MSAFVLKETAAQNQELFILNFHKCLKFIRKICLYAD